MAASFRRKNQILLNFLQIFQSLQTWCLGQWTPMRHCRGAKPRQKKVPTASQPLVQLLLLSLTYTSLCPGWEMTRMILEIWFLDLLGSQIILSGLWLTGQSICNMSWLGPRVKWVRRLMGWWSSYQLWQGIGNLVIFRRTGCFWGPLLGL